MISIFDSLARALRDLFSLRVLWVVIWPMLVAIVLWVVLGVAFWGTFSGWLMQGLDAIGIQVWLADLEPVWIATGIQILLHLMLFVPVVMLTALVLTALFGMPALIRVVAERNYPQLARENGGSMIGSVWNAVIAIVLFIGLWVATLLLWWTGIGLVMPFVAAAYLNQRLFRYDAIAEHANAQEMTLLFRKGRGGWWGLGLLTGLVQFVPVLNLLGPVLAALAFIHYGLARLNQQRTNQASV
ncbi:MAG: EI24 domain-containing protein [Thiobacillus sp.]|nr:EI24 domain-containing protein [Thiobacillus sp.]